MRPIRSILDASFCYVPSVATSVAATWRRAGWRPTTDEERKARRQPTAELLVDKIGAVDAPTAVARRILVRVPSTSRDPLPAHDSDLGAITLRDVTPSRKSYLENETALRSAKVARHRDPPDDRQVTWTAQDAGSTSAYRGAMVFPLSDRK